MDTPAKQLYHCTLIGCVGGCPCNVRSLETFYPHSKSPDLEADLSRRLEAEVEKARKAFCDAGCTSLARVRAAAGVMDMIFLTVHGARLLVRCSTKASSASDVEALQQMHSQRTFDNVVLLTKARERDLGSPDIIAFAELTSKALTLAKLAPGWAL